MINDTQTLPLDNWVLRTSAASPFGRKVRMSLETLGLDVCIRIEDANTSDPHDSLRKQNPLGKVPILLLPDGRVIYDSKIIIDFFNEYDGRSILIPKGDARYSVLVQQALADGVLDAAILQIYERRFRTEQAYDLEWLKYQSEKVNRALLSFEHNLPKEGKEGPHIGEISLASALGYLDLRFQGMWRLYYPALVHWLKEFSERVPAFSKTEFKD